MPRPNLKASSYVCIEQVKHLVALERSRWLGKRVSITVEGKYAGRLAIIDGVIPDSKYGMLYCCMVQRVDGSGPLNSDVESRSYRPLDEFMLLGNESDLVRPWKLSDDS